VRFVGLALAAALVGTPALPEEPAQRPAEGRSDAASTYTIERVRAVVEDHVQRAVRDSDGIYRLADDQAGKTLDLEFIQVSLVSAGNLWSVHDPDRRVDARAYLACTRFHLVGAPEGKEYDVDMLVEPRDGTLVVTEVLLHKEKQLVDGKWIWQARKASPVAGAAKKR